MQELKKSVFTLIPNMHFQVNGTNTGQNVMHLTAQCHTAYVSSLRPKKRLLLYIASSGEKKSACLSLRGLHCYPGLSSSEKSQTKTWDTYVQYNHGRQNALEITDNGIADAISQTFQSYDSYSSYTEGGLKRYNLAAISKSALHICTRCFYSASYHNQKGRQSARIAFNTRTQAQKHNITFPIQSIALGKSKG